jgi:hypothetical protein
VLYIPTLLHVIIGVIFLFVTLVRLSIYSQTTEHHRRSNRAMPYRMFILREQRNCIQNPIHCKYESLFICGIIGLVSINEPRNNFTNKDKDYKSRTLTFRDIRFKDKWSRLFLNSHFPESSIS